MTPILAQRLGADRSFERLYRRHAGDVYRYALVVLRNQADAEDVTQTTFLNAYRAYANGERPRSPQNWLIAIAHNVCRQRFRQSQRRPNEVAFEEELAEAVSDEERISAEDIRRALGHLAFNQRAALVMRELEGRSYQEIGEILDLSVSAVETLIFRARRALREQLEGGITCHEAELAISRQLDGRLSRKDRGALRAHLRECEDCAGFARSQRAQRGALKSLAAIPLPQSLASLFGGGGGATVGGGLAVKAAAVGAGAVLATGVGYESVKHGPWKPFAPAPKAAVKEKKPAISAAVAAPAAVAADVLERARDQKPYRPAAVNAHPRKVKVAVPKSKSLAKARRVAKSKRARVSALLASRGRGHDKRAKPAKASPPAGSKSRSLGQGQGKTRAKSLPRGRGQSHVREQNRVHKRQSPARKRQPAKTKPPAPPKKEGTKKSGGKTAIDGATDSTANGHGSNGKTKP